MAIAEEQRYFLPLLRKHVVVPPGARALELGYLDAGGALWLAGAGARVVAPRPTIDGVTELDRAAREAGVPELEARLAVAPAPAERASFDLALLLAPFFLGNVPVRQAIRATAEALKPDGRLYFQALKRRGGQTFVGYAREVFEDVELLEMGGGQRRLFLATGPRPATASGNPDAESAPGPEDAAGNTTLEVTLRGVSLKLRLAAGVFSAHRIDPGSQLLAQTIDLPGGARILDLGCGAGVVGLALAAADPRARVLLVDASLAAVELAQENAAANGLSNVEVRVSDGYSAVGTQRFDAVVSNLPAHRGQQADSETARRFIANAPAHLREGGEAWLVANKALAYELPASRAFRSVRVATADGRYKVLHCQGPIADDARGAAPRSGAILE